MPKLTYPIQGAQCVSAYLIFTYMTQEEPEALKLETASEDSVRLDALAHKKTGEGTSEHILSSGYLEVGEGQRVYYVEWGNPKGTPFMALHGGPGAGFGASHIALFDPAIHHVVFFDQRGCGASTPPADSLDEKGVEAVANTGNMLADTEALQTKIFGAQKVHVAGGSWGSTLALTYAIEHPEKVASLQ